MSDVDEVSVLLLVFAVLELLFRLPVAQHCSTDGGARPPKVCAAIESRRRLGVTAGRARLGQGRRTDTQAQRGGRAEGTKTLRVHLTFPCSASTDAPEGTTYESHEGASRLLILKPLLLGLPLAFHQAVHRLGGLAMSETGGPLEER